MRNARRLIATLVIVGSFGLGLAVLLSTSARAVENPCDPTYGLLQWCKSQHGRWDAKCCCCRLH